MYLFFHAVFTYWLVAFGAVRNMLLAKILVAAVAYLPAVFTNQFFTFQAFVGRLVYHVNISTAIVASCHDYNRYNTYKDAVHFW